MFRFTGKVKYVGSEELHEFTVGNAALALWEQYAIRKKYPVSGAELPPQLSNLYIAYVGLGIETGFDAWIETVDGIEVTGSDPDKPGEPDVPPTHAAPSAE